MYVYIYISAADSYQNSLKGYFQGWTNHVLHDVSRIICQRAYNFYESKLKAILPCEVCYKFILILIHM